MKLKMAVLGDPIEHSLSPLLHNHAYKELGITASYERFRVSASELPAFLSTHTSSSWQGFSLTMPLKEVGISLANEIDVSVADSHALNTLVRIESGGSNWRGYNTDIFGFSFIFSHLGRRGYFDLSRSSVSILGGGGTARAALVALRQTGAKVNVYRRNATKDRYLHSALPEVQLHDWDAHSDAFSSDLLINTLPSSAFENAEVEARSVNYLIDALYAPWPTVLMGMQFGDSFVSGKDLLVAQALKQIELFSKQTFNYDEMFDLLRSKI